MPSDPHEEAARDKEVEAILHAHGACGHDGGPEYKDDCLCQYGGDLGERFIPAILALLRTREAALIAEVAMLRESESTAVQRMNEAEDALGHSMNREAAAEKKIAELEKERDREFRDKHVWLGVVNGQREALQRFRRGEISARKLAELFRIEDVIEFSRDFTAAADIGHAQEVAAAERRGAEEMRERAARDIAAWPGVMPWEVRVLLPDLLRALPLPGDKA